MTKKKLTLQKMLSYCSEEDVQAIKEGRTEAVEDAVRGFDGLDLNDDGFVEKHELIEMTKKCMELTDEEVEEFFENFDIRQDGNVSREDWEKAFGDMYDK